MEQLPPTLQFLGAEKKREEDPVLRMMCIEILLLLSTSEFLTYRLRIPLIAAFTGREALRTRGAYLVVREHHKAEKDQAVSYRVLFLGATAYEKIADAIERLVSLIQGEEGRDTKSEQIEELVKLPKADAAASASMEEDDDLDVVEV